MSLVVLVFSREDLNVSSFLPARTFRSHYVGVVMRGHSSLGWILHFSGLQAQKSEYTLSLALAHLSQFDPQIGTVTNTHPSTTGV